MEAYQAKKATIKAELQDAMYEIEQMMKFGAESTRVCSGAIDLETAEILSQKGYDVKIVKDDDVFSSYSEVSWKYAQKGRKGKIQVIEKNK